MTSTRRRRARCLFCLWGGALDAQWVGLQWGSQPQAQHPSTHTNTPCPRLRPTQLKAVCVEAGMLALRRDGTEVCHEDFVEGIGAVSAKKKVTKNYYS